MTGQRLRLRQWRVRFGLFGIVALLIVGVVLLPLMQPSEAAPASAAAFDLTSSARMYRVDQAPTFRLHVTAQPADNSLGMFGIAKAYAAADTVKAAVTYKGVATDISPQITKQPGGDYEITVPTTGHHAPGSYHLTATIQTDKGPVVKEQDFAWGVLAINFDQAEYTSGQVAHIYYGVLDSRGHTLCDAPLIATIKQPDGTSRRLIVTPSGSCDGDNYQALPDYASEFTPTVTGDYQVTIKLADSAYEQSDTFKVVESAPYQITRSGPSRIYPPSPYAMTLSVQTTAAYTGTISDSLPDSFTLVDAGGAVTTKHDGKIVLTWQVSWPAGSTHTISYHFKAPPVSPAFYFVGPAVMKSPVTGADYTEGRQWQIAGDATITVVNTSYFPQQTASGGATTYTLSAATTAGNTLVLLYGATGSSAGVLLRGVTDSAGNTWVSPVANTTSNLPPSTFNSGGASAVGIAYVTNAASVTSVTAMMGATTNHGVTIMELSGVASGIAGIAGIADSQAASMTHASTGLPIQLCDQITTDQQMRGGNYFCANDAVIVIGNSVAGQQTTYGTMTSGYTGLTTICVAATCGANSNKMAAAYDIINASTTTSITWTGLAANPAGLATIALRQEKLGSYENSYFWAK